MIENRKRVHGGQTHAPVFLPRCLRAVAIEDPRRPISCTRGNEPPTPRQRGQPLDFGITISWYLSGAS